MTEATDTFALPLVVDGEKVVIRPLAAEDAPAMHEAIVESAAELSWTMPWWHEDFSLEETSDWAQYCELRWQRGRYGDHFAFAILSKQSGEFLGSCAIEAINPHNLSANLSYWVRTSRTRRGVASEAARLAARWGCRELALQRIEILALVHNLASQGAALKAGATREGVLRNRMRAHHQQYDGVMFSLIPSDFAEDE